MTHLRSACVAAIAVLLFVASGHASAQPLTAGLEFSAVLKPDGTGWQFGYYTRTPTHTTSSLVLTDAAAGSGHIRGARQ